MTKDLIRLHKQLYCFTWPILSLQTTTGAHCKVLEPLFNFEFNLNSLRKEGSDYHVHWGDYDYLINICGPLQGSCGDSSDVGMCQTKPQDSDFTPVDAGKKLFTCAAR